MNIRLLILIYIVSIGSLKGQNEKYKKKPKLGTSLGIAYQEKITTDLNLIYNYDYKSRVSSTKIGLEAIFNNNQFVLGPKVGQEINLYLFRGNGILNRFTIRGSLIDYIDNKRNDLRLLPEIGLNYKYIVYLTYGYSIPLLNYKINDLSRHRISLTINLFSKK